MCTDVFNSSNLVSGRTIDFAFPAPLKLQTYQSGQEMQGYFFEGERVVPVKGHVWQNNHGFIAAVCGVDGVDATFDGINDAGLSVCSLEFNDSIHQYNAANSDPAKNICVYFAPALLLGTCGSVQDCKALLTGGAINVTDVSSLTPFGSHLHVHDAAGNSMVFEWINGVVNCYDNTSYGCCTNSPPTPLCRYLLHTYSSITPLNADPSDNNIKPLSNGSGLRGLPADATSDSRYVRSYFYNQFALMPVIPSSANTLQERLGLMSNIIGKIEVLRGEVNPGGAYKILGLSDYTQISFVRIHDTKEGIGYFYRTQYNPQWFGIDKIDFSQAKTFTISDTDSSQAFQSLV